MLRGNISNIWPFLSQWETAVEPRLFPTWKKYSCSNAVDKWQDIELCTYMYIMYIPVLYCILWLYIYIYQCLATWQWLWTFPVHLQVCRDWVDTLLDRDTSNSNRRWKRLKLRSFLILYHSAYLTLKKKTLIVISSNFQRIKGALATVASPWMSLVSKCPMYFLAKTAKWGISTHHMLKLQMLSLDNCSFQKHVRFW